MNTDKIALFLSFERNSCSTVCLIADNQIKNEFFTHQLLGIGYYFYGLVCRKNNQHLIIAFAVYPLYLIFYIVCISGSRHCQIFYCIYVAVFIFLGFLLAYSAVRTYTYGVDFPFCIIIPGS